MHARLHSTAAAQDGASQPQLSRLDGAVCALVTSQAAVRPMIIRVLRYLRLGFEMIREKVLNELSDLSTLSANERTNRVQNCHATALQLAMAHEVRSSSTLRRRRPGFIHTIFILTGQGQPPRCDTCSSGCLRLQRTRTIVSHMKSSTGHGALDAVKVSCGCSLCAGCGQRWGGSRPVWVCRP